MTQSIFAARFSALLTGAFIAAGGVAGASPVDPATGTVVAAAPPPPPSAGATVPTATKVTHPVP